ncbi:hypothetical protein EV174_003938 [Coemansia sp. RSA 2320]|nr:hypothetical protein EV174_003938 [Coemansia sp. RSA 2320]
MDIAGLAFLATVDNGIITREMHNQIGILIQSRMQSPDLYNESDRRLDDLYAKYAEDAARFKNSPLHGPASVLDTDRFSYKWLSRHNKHQAAFAYHWDIPALDCMANDSLSEPFEPTASSSGGGGRDGVEQADDDTQSADARGTRLTPPTWAEVMQTRTKATRNRGEKPGSGSNDGRNEEAEAIRRLCIVDKFHISTSDFVSERALPVIGKVSCLELVSAKAAQRQLVERRKHSDLQQRGGWADEWYGRWLLRWQFTTILGKENIKKFEEHIPRSMQTVEFVRTAIEDDDERRRLTRVLTLDEAMATWPRRVAAFYQRLFRPGAKMCRMYVESWQNGKQQVFLSRFWDSAVNLGGVKLAGRAFSSMAKSWGELGDDGDDKKQP